MANYTRLFTDPYQSLKTEANRLSNKYPTIYNFLIGLAVILAITAILAAICFVPVVGPIVSTWLLGVIAAASSLTIPATIFSGAIAAAIFGSATTALWAGISAVIAATKAIFTSSEITTSLEEQNIKGNACYPKLIDALQGDVSNPSPTFNRNNEPPGQNFTSKTISYQSSPTTPNTSSFRPNHS